jgi:hypothetical protein
MGCEILSRDPFLFFVAFTPTKRLALGGIFTDIKGSNWRISGAF